MSLSENKIIYICNNSATPLPYDTCLLKVEHLTLRWPFVCRQVSIYRLKDDGKDGPVVKAQLLQHEQEDDHTQPVSYPNKNKHVTHLDPQIRHYWAMAGVLNF